MGEILWREAPVRRRPGDRRPRFPATRRRRAFGRRRLGACPRRRRALIKNRLTVRPPAPFIQPGQGSSANTGLPPQVQTRPGRRSSPPADRRRRRTSIVRGNNHPGRSSGMLPQGGKAREVHMCRISAGAADPANPCHLRRRHVDPRGDDRPTAARSRRIADELDADKPRLPLSMEGVYEAIGGSPRRPFCDGLPSGGHYPLGDPGGTPKRQVRRSRTSPWSLQPP